MSHGGLTLPFHSSMADFIAGLPKAIANSQVFSTELPNFSLHTALFGLGSTFQQIDFYGVVWALMPWTTGEAEKIKNHNFHSDDHSMLGNAEYAVVFMPRQLDLTVLMLQFLLGLILCVFFSLVACCYSRTKRSGPIDCCKVPFVTMLCAMWMICVGVAFNFYLRFKEEYNLEDPRSNAPWGEIMGVPTTEIGLASVAIKGFLESFAGFSEEQVRGTGPLAGVYAYHYVHWPMASITFALMAVFVWLQVTLSLMLCCGWGCFACSKRMSAGEQRRAQRKLEEEEETYVNNYNSTHATTVAVKV